jgi:hypothetical protein
MYPFYQVFDAYDKPVNWAPFGHRLDNGDNRCGSCSPHPYWIDNDRFVTFWTDYTHVGPGGAPVLYGRIFSNRGQTPHEICAVSWGDSLEVAPNTEDPFSLDVSSLDKFAYTHERMYKIIDSSAIPRKAFRWTHDAGFLSEIVGNEPQRKTSLFEYTPAWDPDTVWCATRYAEICKLQKPAVACNDERIVWAYCRLNPDTVFEAYALVTDWNMGVGTGEKPISASPSSFELLSSIGPTVTLRYSNCASGFRARVFDAAGREVDEVQSSTTSGTIEWGGGHGCYGCYGCYGPGVYFIIAEGSKANPKKAILVK